jgi:ABC-2 type transport system permease protein
MSIAPTPTPEEFAPSHSQDVVPHLSRTAGMVGLFLLTIGTASVVAAERFERGPLGSGYGYLAGAVGLALLLIHALRDSDLEIRRMYGGFGLFLLAVGVLAGVVPGGDAGKVGYNLLPWGFAFGAVALLFLVPFSQHETDTRLRNLTEKLLLGVGALLSAGAIGVGIVRPDTLVGPGLLLALLGLAYLCAFLTTTDTSVGLGYRVAVGLGVLGAVALVVAVGRAVVPTVLFDGPSAVKDASLKYDSWKVVGRVAAILLCLGGAALGLVRSLPVWFRTVAAIFGLALAGVFVTGTFSKVLVLAPAQYLVPYGLILAGLGLAFLAVSAAVVTDNQFVVLTRRELAGYFYSPIAYLVLFGMVVVTGVGYLWFLLEVVVGRGVPVAEPIVQQYPSLGIVSAFLVVFIVPALTMRLFSEEQRTGTLEVLLTAPVGDGAIVISKFVACWLFLMACWMPAGLYLVALRVEGGIAFDYRPLLAYYLAMAACGASFTAIGLFFSSITRNQIVSAVLTGSVMFLIVLTVLNQLPGLPNGLRVVMAKFDVLQLWREALAGQLAVQTVVFHLSLAAFFLFLTSKVLEVRKWS